MPINKQDTDNAFRDAHAGMESPPSLVNKNVADLLEGLHQDATAVRPAVDRGRH